MLNTFVKALANPPPEVVVSFRFVSGTICVAAGVTAMSVVGVFFATRVVPVVMWGRSEDAGAMIVAQVQGLAFVLAKAEVYARMLFSF